jgi:hypothetical protein
MYQGQIPRTVAAEKPALDRRHYSISLKQAAAAADQADGCTIANQSRGTIGIHNLAVIYHRGSVLPMWLEAALLLGETGL